MAVETGGLNNINASGAEVDALVIDVGESGLSEFGWCVGRSPSPTINDCKINNGAKESYGNYSNILTGLNPGTRYYVRSYISGGGQTLYGDELELITNDLIFTIDYPEGNAILAKGRSYDITWNVNINDKLKIELFKADSFSEIICNELENSGKFIWTIDTSLIDGDDYKIVISSSVNEIINAETSFFGIYKEMLPKVSTIEVSNIDYFSAQAKGNIEHFGTETSVSQYGHCWSTNENPTIEDSITEYSNNISLEPFTSSLDNLRENTTYYVRTYAINSIGTSYGEQISFTTLDAKEPTVSTSAVTEISYTETTCGGTVSSTGTHAVTTRGVCWSTIENPSVDNDKTVDGSGTGLFSSNITGLHNNTTYYYRAYATNSIGTSYGEQRIVTTVEATPPTVITTSVTDINYTSATCGGEVLNANGYEVTTRGVCWSISSNPTIFDNKTVDGSGLGNFISSIEGLTENVVYYVRAYATNQIGTSYGNEISYTTTNYIPGTVTDYDGNIYNHLLIGNQIWMAENLKVIHYSDGTSVPNVTDDNDWNSLTITDKAYCYYDNSSYNGDTFGALYTWAAAMNGAEGSSSNPSGVQGICPVGWHLPSNDEWEELIDYLIANGYGYEGSGNDVAKSLASSSLWSTSQTEGAIGYNASSNNSSGFNGLPSGYRGYEGGFFLISNICELWSSSVGFNSQAASALYLNSNSIGVSVTNNLHKNDGFPIRCLKD